MAKQGKYSYNPKTMMYEEQEVSKYAVYAKYAGYTVVLLALMWFYSWLYLDVFKLQLPKTAILKNRNMEWTSRISILDHNLNQQEMVLRGLEERDNYVYRSIFGMNVIPDDARESDNMIPDDDSEYRKLPSSSSLLKAKKHLDNLSRRSIVQSKSLDEISLVARDAGDMISCIPAVSPILPDRSKVHLSSSYGYRRDPVYGGTAFHSGQDFAAPKGYSVYAPGDGVVEKVEYQFRGYGNEIIIDHGFGYKTLFAHLSVIDVQEGVKVKRGDKIGEVGNTGKSTGPHLHYEVEYKGRNVNPMPYVDMDITLDEYMAMVRNREESNVQSKTHTTAEILNRVSKN